MPASPDRLPGTAELCNWAALVDDGIVQCKDGSLLAGYFFVGPDPASAPAEVLNNLSYRINSALRSRGGGWASWTDAVRLDAAGYAPSAVSHFPDRWSRLVDEERRQQFEAEGWLLETHKAFLLSYTPPLRRYSRIGDLVYSEEGNTRNTLADRILAKFKADLVSFENAVGGAIQLRRMTSFPIGDGRHYSDELVNYLNFCLSGLNLTLQLPDDGGYLDGILSMRPFTHGLMPRYGRNYIAAVEISGFPEQTLPQILAALDLLGFPYRWSTRMIYLDRAEAIKELDRMRAKWEQKQRGFFSQMLKSVHGRINQDAVAMTAQADEELKLAEAGEYAHGYHTSVVILMDPDPQALVEKARMVEKTVQASYFDAFYDDLNTTEAWRGALPGHVKPNVFRPLIHTGNLANLLPLSTIFTGSDRHPNPMYPENSPAWFWAVREGETPLRLSLHCWGDVGHGIILGPIGSGKSFLLCFLLLQALRYRGATIFAFDKGYSLKTAALFCGGVHYDLAGDDMPGLCPLSGLDSEADVGWAEFWVSTCFQLQHGRKPSPANRDAIHRAMQLHSQAPDASITHFMALCQDEEVRAALRYYSTLGPMGRLLDAERDGMAEANVIVCEIGDLMKLDQVASIPVLLYLNRRFDRSLKGQPAFFFNDEGWVILFNDMLRAWQIENWKTKRKACCAMIMATQSLSDIVRSGALPDLIENCPNRIFLPNAEARVTGTRDHPGPLDLYQAIGLNDTVIDLIEHGVPKRDYYYDSPESKGPFRLDPGPILRAIAGVSDPKDVARIDALRRLYGEGWREAWLAERGAGDMIEVKEAAE